MAVNTGRLTEILGELGKDITLVAVSKIKPAADIMDLYAAGQRDFGENYVQELVDKYAKLPTDIRWHFIGHLQSNKIKHLIDFVHLIQGVDSYKLLQEINKQAAKINRVVHCLLQVHIAKEDTKFGFDASELETAMANLGALANVRVCGLMGMASFSDDASLVRAEYRHLRSLFDLYTGRFVHPSSTRPVLSMGMSDDYRIALEEGSTMVRIGSAIFGPRKRPE